MYLILEFISQNSAKQWSSKTGVTYKHMSHTMVEIFIDRHRHAYARYIRYLSGTLVLCTQLIQKFFKPK